MILVVNALSARLGGGQTYLRQLFAYLPDRADVEIHVFAPASLGVPRAPNVYLVGTGWPTGSPLLRAVWERLVLPRYLRQVGAHVLFCPGGVVATRAPTGCRTVTMFRNMIPFDDRLVREMRFGRNWLRNVVLEKAFLRSMAAADQTIFVSDYGRRVVEARVPLKSAVTISHGIDERFRVTGDPPARPSDLPAGDYLLYVSRFDDYKHHLEVVRAYAALPAVLRARLALVFIGETNLPAAERVERLVAQHGLGDRVRVLGAVPYGQLPAYYRHAFANLFASSCENCPNILLESLAAGRPVLSSDVMPMPEFGRDAVEYFSPFEPASIATAIRRVAEDPALAQRLGDAAAQLSRSYDWRRTAAATWDVLIGASGAQTSPAP